MLNTLKNSNDLDLTQYNDLQLLFIFTELVSKEADSTSLQKSAWEIIRRYTNQLQKNEKGISNTKHDEPKWGDAKRVMLLYGIGRTVLDNLRKKGLITSKALGKGRPGARVKRLYNLGSIDAYLLSIESN